MGQMTLGDRGFPIVHSSLLFWLRRYRGGKDHTLYLQRAVREVRRLPRYRAQKQTPHSKS